MSIYDDLKPVASELLKEFKQGVVKLVSMAVTGSADAPTNTETLITLNATVRGVSFQYMKNDFVVASDLEVTAAVVDNVTPTIHDLIEIDGVRHKIVKDVSVPSAGTKIVWKFIVRKGG